MDCPHEEKLIRDRLEGMEGVDSLLFDLKARVLTVRLKDGSQDSVEEAIALAGMTPARLEPGAGILDFPGGGRQGASAAGDACCPSCARPEPAEARFSVGEMDCPREEKLIRERLEGLEGVESLAFDLQARVLTVRLADGSRDGAVEEAIAAAGMTPVRLLPGAPGQGGAGASPARPKPDISLAGGEPGTGAEGAAEEPGACCSACSQGLSAPPAASAASGKGPARGLVRYSIADMCCPVEERLIRGSLKGMEGIESLEFSLLNRTLAIRHSLPSLDGVTAAIERLGMRPVLLEGGAASPEAGGSLAWGRLAAAAVLAGASEACHVFLDQFWPSLALAAAAILLGGLATYKKGWLAIRRLDLNMNALMSFAVTGALLIGDFPEAAMVMVLFTLAEALEERSLGRARQAISGLVESAPETCTVRGPDGAFAETRASGVPAGSVVRVRPGERLSLDGRVISGSSAVNEAPITGESRPADKGPGDMVYSGTVNEFGSFEYETTQPFENSTLARILKAVEEAQAAKAPTQRFVDRFAAIYTPAVFAAALLIGAVPPLVTGEPWLGWIYRALVTLVIACPCALVISTPVTIVSGLAAATRKGLLVKGGTFLEEGRKLRTLAFDKTGTVTVGRPALTDVEPWDGCPPEELRSLGGSLAGRSDHPVSRAVFQGLGLRPHETIEPEGFRALPGEGSAGSFGGRELFLGNLRLARRLGPAAPGLEGLVSRLESQGKSAVTLFEPGRILGVFAVADQVRPESREALEELSRMGVMTVMLTGDNEGAAAAAAAQVGGVECRSGLLPEDKLSVIRELSASGKVGMAGDGINDAPALAEADIGFSMGAAGTGAAIETSDVAIMDDDLRKIPSFIRLSRETAWHLWENIGFSILVKLVFIALTFFGFTKMWMAIFADMGVCLIVVANGLRLLGKVPGRRERPREARGPACGPPGAPGAAEGAGKA
jgi:Cd2+/Zn2+-exporting ATPase